MKLQAVWSLLLIALCSPSVYSASEVHLRRAERTATLENDSIKLVIDWSSGPVRLVSVADRHGKVPQFQDADFALQFGDNRLVTTDQCRVVDAIGDTKPDGRVRLLLRRNTIMVYCTVAK